MITVSKNQHEKVQIIIHGPKILINSRAGQRYNIMSAGEKKVTKQTNEKYYSCLHRFEWLNGLVSLKTDMNDLTFEKNAG